MNYLNPYYYFGSSDVVDEEINDAIDQEEVELLGDESEIGNMLINRGYVTSRSLYQNEPPNKDYNPGTQLETGAEGQVGITLNQQLLREYIQRLQDLDVNRRIINQRIESQLNNQIDLNNVSIVEIDENIPEKSDDLIQLNTLNQQKVQLLLLNIEYQEKIIYNMIQSDSTRIEEITGILNTLTRVNSSLLDSLTEIVSNELENLQLQITENEDMLNNLNLQKRNFRQELGNLQVEFELLIQEKLKQEEERSINNSRKRYMENDEYSSSKKSRY